MKITYVPAENCIAEYGNKQAVLKRFEGLKKKTLDSYLTDMRKIPDFRGFVINPSQKVVWINFEGFLNYLHYRQDHRFKRGA
jgi:hypothetical protein